MRHTLGPASGAQNDADGMPALAERHRQVDLRRQGGVQAELPAGHLDRDGARAGHDQLEKAGHFHLELALEHETADEVEKDLTLVDVLIDESSIEPSSELETRELHGYLRDAISLLPERHRLVIIGYFLEGRTSQDLADFLDVTESRISQLRSESLLMLKEGIEAQYLAERPDPLEVTGRVARRKATYARGIGEASKFADRMELVNLIESDAPAIAGF